jgi:hypothetical protein
MTEDKARKRAIRRRMAKTGERYTAARRHVVHQPESPTPVVDPGMTDESIRRGSGKGWDEWFRILDRWGATSRTHKEIARYVNAEHGVSGWWAQSVTVGYERARGMRAKHQVAGGFQVTVSKTFPVGVDRLFRAFADARQRGRWLEAGTLKVRTSQPGRSARFDFREDAGRVMAYFTSKGPAKATVHVQHDRLADARAVEAMRAFWRERLARLGDVLTS